MNQKQLLILAGVLLLFSTATPVFADPVALSSETDLLKIGNEYPLNGDYLLTADIPLTGTWTPIGTTAHPFTGTIDGGFHIISEIKTADTEYAGFIGVAEGAVIRNLNLNAVTVRGKTAGGLIGLAYASDISNCHLYKGTVTGSRIAGGILGEICTGSSVSYCYTDQFTVIADGASCIGGFAGCIDGTCRITSTLANVETSGILIAGDAPACMGGFAGCIGSPLIEQSGICIKDCYSLGAVTAEPDTASAGYYCIGSFAGAIRSAGVKNSYATGKITGNAAGTPAAGAEYCLGGFAGYADTGASIDSCLAACTKVNFTGASVPAENIRIGTLIGCLPDTTVTLANNYIRSTMLLNGLAPQVYGADTPSGSPAEYAEMQTAAFYKNKLGWDIGTEEERRTWYLVEGSYPWLTIPEESTGAPAPTATPAPAAGIIAGIIAGLCLVRRNR